MLTIGTASNEAAANGTDASSGRAVTDVMLDTVGSKAGREIIGRETSAEVTSGGWMTGAKDVGTDRPAPRELAKDVPPSASKP